MSYKISSLSDSSSSDDEQNLQHLPDILTIDDLPELNLSDTSDEEEPQVTRTSIKEELRKITSPKVVQPFNPPFEAIPKTEQNKRNQEQLIGPWQRLITRPRKVPTSNKAAPPTYQPLPVVSYKTPPPPKKRKVQETKDRVTPIPSGSTTTQNHTHKGSGWGKTPSRQHFICEDNLWAQVCTQPIPWDIVFNAKSSSRFKTEDGDTLRFTKIKKIGKIKIRLQQKRKPWETVWIVLSYDVLFWRR